MYTKGRMGGVKGIVGLCIIHVFEWATIEMLRTYVFQGKKGQSNDRRHFLSLDTRVVAKQNERPALICSCSYDSYRSYSFRFLEMYTHFTRRCAYHISIRAVVLSCFFFLQRTQSSKPTFKIKFGKMSYR